MDLCSPNLRPLRFPNDDINSQPQLIPRLGQHHRTNSTAQGTDPPKPFPSAPPKLIDAQSQMLARAAARVPTTTLVARRGFQTTRARLSSPYHYPEGPYTNIPFDPKKKTFPILYWGFMITGFSAPFLIAGAWFLCLTMWTSLLTRSQSGKQRSPRRNRETSKPLLCGGCTDQLRSIEQGHSQWAFVHKWNRRFEALSCACSMS